MIALTVFSEFCRWMWMISLYIYLKGLLRKRTRLSVEIAARAIRSIDQINKDNTRREGYFVNMKLVSRSRAPPTSRNLTLRIRNHARYEDTFRDSKAWVLPPVKVVKFAELHWNHRLLNIVVNIVMVNELPGKNRFANDFSRPSVHPLSDRANSFFCGVKQIIKNGQIQAKLLLCFVVRREQYRPCLW